MVALNAAGEVCLLRQYRHVAGGWLWEVPAGKLDGKTPDATARAELAEEAGMVARDWQSLGHVVSSPGVFREVVHLYLARELTPVPAAPEREEVFEVQLGAARRGGRPRARRRHRRRQVGGRAATRRRTARRRTLTAHGRITFNFRELLSPACEARHRSAGAG